MTVKHIAKGGGPKSLQDWKQGQQDAGLTPTFGDLQNPVKAACREALLREQGALCCYCNSRIRAGHMHIEHLEPRSVRRDLEVVWTNLLGCCQPQNLKGHKLRSQCHCGEHRRNLSVGVSPYGDLEVLTEDEWLLTYAGMQEGEYAEFAAMFRWFYNNGWSDEKRAL